MNLIFGQPGICHIPYDMPIGGAFEFFGWIIGGVVPGPASGREQSQATIRNQ